MAVTVSDHVQEARLVLPCTDLQALIDFLTTTVGMRLVRIFPADSPSVADLSGKGLNIRLDRSAPASSTPIHLQALCDLSSLSNGTPTLLSGPEGWQVELIDSVFRLDVPEGHQAFVLTRMPKGDGEGWGKGRAGMMYRDLIPDRLGGRFIASHIAIPNGGPVPDYVHYHNVRFQMIFCYKGWVRVVYEDQGPPFVLEAGDCVLQPPAIRHRVLEASDGLEVIEIGCPAIHETCVEHTITLPNCENPQNPDRIWEGQRFVRHIAKGAPMLPVPGWAGAEGRDTGIGGATDGLARVWVVKGEKGYKAALRHEGEYRFVFVLEGSMHVASGSRGTHTLGVGDSVVLPAGEDFEVATEEVFSALEVCL